jgi:transcriptional regulator GlxA family with amidase domain
MVSGIAPAPALRRRRRSGVRRPSDQDRVRWTVSLASAAGAVPRAFRRTPGVAPHKWLIEQRVVPSQDKLSDDGLSLSDVARSAASATKVTSHTFSEKRSA